MTFGEKKSQNYRAHIYSLSRFGAGRFLCNLHRRQALSAVQPEELAGTTTTASQWLEIVPQSPLRVERQRQMIALDLDKSIQTEREGSGLVLPDGSIVRPQVQLVSKDGKIYELNRPSFFLSNTGEILAYFSRADLPNDQSYIKVRIRSDRPVRCNRILWRNYNLWDAESPF
jgi:hypothetical protein